MARNPRKGKGVMAYAVSTPRERGERQRKMLLMQTAQRLEQWPGVAIVYHRNGFTAKTVPA